MLKVPEYVEFVAKSTVLTPQDKFGVLGILAQCSSVPEEFKSFHQKLHGPLSPWTSCGNIQGIQIDKQFPRAPNRVFRVRGVGTVDISPKAAFELVCNLDMIPRWDMLYKNGKIMNYDVDFDGCCEVGYLHMVYGVPGFSFLINDRDFVIRAVRVQFPDGVKVTWCSSVSDIESRELGVVPPPSSVRALLSDSGFVCFPAPDGSGKCVLELVLQVDPKGWIPPQVVNFCAEAIPLNISRIRNVVKKLPDDLKSTLPDLTHEQVFRHLVANSRKQADNSLNGNDCDVEYVSLSYSSAHGHL